MEFLKRNKLPVIIALVGICISIIVTYYKKNLQIEIPIKDMEEDRQQIGSIIRLNGEIIILEDMAQIHAAVHAYFLKYFPRTPRSAAKNCIAMAVSEKKYDGMVLSEAKSQIQTLEKIAKQFCEFLQVSYDSFIKSMNYYVLETNSTEYFSLFEKNVIDRVQNISHDLPAERVKELYSFFAPEVWISCFDGTEGSISHMKRRISILDFIYVQFKLNEGKALELRKYLYFSKVSAE